ncbi:MAG TPA: PQQ-binding-like beta-propeller repeat protein [Gammaproteobacteria bacterium]|nr:PQQ-binding-like beta-propeller repeat protein [Gammaproteobacteria bacterium]
MQRWGYQFTPHDTWDYDGVNETILTPLTYKGKQYEALVQANRNGWFYALNRKNGKLIYAKPFVRVTSVTGMNSKGEAITNSAVRPKIGKEIFTCPSFLGGKNWWPMSVDPQTSLAYVPTLHACMTMRGASVSYMAGLPYLGETFKVVPVPGHHHWGSVQAVNLKTGKQVWQQKTQAPWNGGMLSTAGGLVFSGSVTGHFVAFNAKTGKIMWDSGKLSSGIIGVPTTYTVGGKQYVAVWAGWGGATPIWGGVMAKDPTVKKIARGGHLYVFALQQ